MMDGDDTIDHVTQLAAPFTASSSSMPSSPLRLSAFSQIFMLLSCRRWDQDDPVAGIRTAVRISCDGRHI
jgi:hypothetical protein